MIGHKLVPSREGGIEVAVEALSVRMAARGHDVTLYNRGGQPCAGPGRTDQIYRGVHIRQIPVIAKRGIAAVTGSLLATLHAIFGHYDCIHYHAEGPAVMTFLPHFLRIRTVVTIHGLDWKRSKWGRFASWYIKQGEKMAAACADEIIVLSQAAKQYFMDCYQRQTIYIPNGVERPVLRAASLISEQWGLEKDSYILYLGRIVPEKGLECLIKAFGRVKTDKKMVIAGEPSDTDEFYARLLEAAKGDERIIFTGFVQGETLEELYSNSYLYCLPSELEGMPISLLEAMSYGNCCLSSDIAECVEVVGQLGYRFKTGDPEDLCSVLQRLCDQPEQVENCREQVREEIFARHNWDQITERTLALYRKDGSD